MSHEYRTLSVPLRGEANTKIAGIDLFARPNIDRVVQAMAAQGWELIGIAASGDFVHVMVTKSRRG